MQLLVGEPAQAVVRALLFAGILGMLGGALFAHRLAPAFEEASARAQARELALRVMRVAAALLSVVIAARLVQQAAAFADTPAEWTSSVTVVLTQTRWGVGWIVQAAALPWSMVAAERALTREPPPSITLGVGLVVLAATPAMSGHAVGAPRLATLAVLYDIMHVLAAGAWLGTLAFIAFVCLPLGRRCDGAVMTRVLARFSPIALTSAVTLAATGVFASWLHLETLAALWTSDYGLMLVRKIVLLAGVAAVGAYNWRVVTPRLTTSGDLTALRRSTVIELTLALALVAVTALLVATPLPAEM